LTDSALDPIIAADYSELTNHVRWEGTASGILSANSSGVRHHAGGEWAQAAPPTVSAAFT